MRGRVAGFMMIALVLLVGCASAGGGGSPTPDSVVAVNARATIDAVEAAHVTLCRWAVAEHAATRMSDARYVEVRDACDAVAAAEMEANAQLSSYLSTGSLDAKAAITNALSVLAQQWAALNSKRGG